MHFRESEVAISHKTRWQLTRIVKATKSTDAMDSNGTVDALAERILSDWLKDHCPALADLWNKRQQIDTEAEALAAPTKTEKA